MAHLISDIMYKNLKCSQCAKYLSVLPVKVYKDGTIKCGRCCKYNDGGAISLSTQLLTNCFFKCINHYEGCRKLLKPAEVFDHEQSCVGGYFECKECHSFNGSIYEIAEHFKSTHPTHVLQENDLLTIDIVSSTLDRPVHRTFLLVKNDIVCMILTRLCAEEFLFSVVLFKKFPDVSFDCTVFSAGDFAETQCWTNIKCASMEKFQIDYCSFKSDFKKNTWLKLILKLNVKCDCSYYIQDDYQPAEVYNNTPEPVGDSSALASRRSVKLTSLFKRKFPDYTLSVCGSYIFDSKGEIIELLCSNCNTYIGINVFICSNREHWLCEDCNNLCVSCELLMVKPISLYNHYEKLCLMLYPCKWERCKAYVVGKEKLSHESNCDKAILQCPTCFRLYDLPVMKLHVVREHKSEFIDIPLNNLYWYTQCDTVFSIHFLKNNLLFHFGRRKNVQGRAEIFLTMTSSFSLDYPFYIDISRSYPRLVMNEAIRKTKVFREPYMDQDNKYWGLYFSLMSFKMYEYGN